MDTTTIQSQIDVLNEKIVTDEATLSDDKTKLSQLQAELSQATLINTLESLTVKDVAAINSALSADGSQLVLILPIVAM